MDPNERPDFCSILSRLQLMSVGELDVLSLLIHVNAQNKNCLT